MQDRIEREVTIRAAKERVFNAIADPAQIVKWFPDTLEGEWKVGGRPVMGFGEQYGKYSVHVVKVDPYDYFAYRWVQTLDPKGFIGDVLAHPNTIVEFHLWENAGATIVKVTETGFAGLSPEIAKKKFDDNSGGWDYFVDALRKYAEA